MTDPKESMLATATEMLNHPRVEVNLTYGHKDVSGRGDRYLRWEYDGSATLTIRTPPTK